MARCGICPQGTIWRAESTYVELGLARIQPWWWFGRGVAEASPATSLAEAEARLCSCSWLLWPRRCGESIYAARGV